MAAASLLPASRGAAAVAQPHLQHHQLHQLHQQWQAVCSNSRSRRRCRLAVLAVSAAAAPAAAQAAAAARRPSLRPAAQPHHRRGRAAVACRADAGDGDGSSSAAEPPADGSSARTRSLLDALVPEPPRPEPDAAAGSEPAAAASAAAAAAADAPPAAAAPPSSSEPAAASNPAIAGADAVVVPRAVVETLRTAVFGADTMWVTEVENYNGDGVVFKGNIRAKDTAKAGAKMRERLRAAVGDDWQLFLLRDKDERPTAVLLPASAREGTLSPLAEAWLCVVFGALAVVSSFQAAGIPSFQFLIDPFHTLVTRRDLAEALPLVGTFWLTLLAHEAGHRAAAARRGQGLYLPLIIPAGFGFLGAFGGITRFRGFVASRDVLLDVAAAGPLWGTATSGALLLAGLGLTSAGFGDVTIDTAGLADSLLVGLLSQLFLGDALAQPELQVSSLLVAGFGGLTVNALNLLPTGELDGGRMALALYGRRPATALGVATIIALAISSFNNPLAFYWVLLILALQRGPLLPCQDELTPPPEAAPARRYALALLLLPLLVLLPYPVDLLVAVQSLPDPTPF